MKIFFKGKWDNTVDEDEWTSFKVEASRVRHRPIVPIIPQVYCTYPHKRFQLPCPTGAKNRPYRGKLRQNNSPIVLDSLVRLSLLLGFIVRYLFKLLINVWGMVPNTILCIFELPKFQPNLGFVAPFCIAEIL